MFKKFIISIVTLGFIFIPALVFAETMWAIIPSQPKKSGMVKWAWTWGKYMNKNIHNGSRITKIDFKYVPGNRGKNGLKQFERVFKFNNFNMIVSTGGAATATLLEDVGGYDFRKYTPIVIHPGNMFVPVHKSFNSKVDKNLQAINGNGGSEPEHFASGLLVCPYTNDIDKFLTCFKEKITIVRGVSSSNRHIMFLNGELTVGRISANGWLSNKLYKKHKNKIRIWFHHCQMNFKTGQWGDDPQKEFQGLCFDDVFEKTHGFAPVGKVYDAYVLTRLWRDGLQKTFFVNKNNENINDLIKIAESTMQDKSFEKERFKKLGKYPVYIGKDAELVVQQVYKALTNESLTIAVKFVNDGLGYKVSVKEELFK